VIGEQERAEEALPPPALRKPLCPKCGGVMDKLEYKLEYIWTGPGPMEEDTYARAEHLERSCSTCRYKTQEDILG
jgi:hypothetical protein